MKEFTSDCGKYSLKVWEKDAETLNIGGVDLGLDEVESLRNDLNDFLGVL